MKFLNELPSVDRGLFLAHRRNWFRPSRPFSAKRWCPSLRYWNRRWKQVFRTLAIRSRSHPAIAWLSPDWKRPILLQSIRSPSGASLVEGHSRFARRTGLCIHLDDRTSIRPKCTEWRLCMEQNQVYIGVELKTFRKPFRHHLGKPLEAKQIDY